MQSEITNQFVKAIARYMVIFALGLLVSKGLIPQTLADAVSENTIALVVTLILTIVPVALAYLRIRKNAVTTEVALELPAGSSLRTAKQIAKNRIRQGIN